MNYFKKTFRKYLLKGEDPAKLASDLGHLKGYVQVTEYDPSDGRIINVSQQQNTVVNSSKSNVIRLISQGHSPWAGTINPVSCKISKMRFGNSNGGLSAVSQDLYYKLNEPSMLTNTAGGLLHPGGCPTGVSMRSFGYQIENSSLDANLNGCIVKTGSFSAGSGHFTVNKYDIDSDNVYKLIGWNSFPISSLSNSESLMPPTSLVVQLCINNEVKDEMHFSDKFHYGSGGVFPTQIIKKQNNTDTNKKLFKCGAERTDKQGDILNVTSLMTKSRVVYDYTSGQNKWIMYLQFTDTILTTDNATIKIYFKMGMNNVINTIVPRSGYNLGCGLENGIMQGLTFDSRFKDCTSSKDYYDILSNCEYRDSDSDLIKDYSVTFACNMAGQYGNGSSSAGENIRYTEAFLFSGAEGNAEYDNELFSAIKLATPFDKNSNNAYYISWTILAPIN